MKEEKVFFENSEGIKICGMLKEPKENDSHIVILFHGMPSSKQSKSINQVSDEILERDISTLCIDLRGNGESEGKFEEQTITGHVIDGKSAIEFVKSRGYKKIDLLGSSASGPVVIELAKSKDINRVAFKSPVSDYKKQIEKWFRRNAAENKVTSIEEWKEKGFHYKSPNGGEFDLDYSFCEDALSYDSYESARKIECPALIMHSDIDAHVDIEQSKELVANIEDGSLIIVEGGDHLLKIDGDNSYANKTFADWFEKGAIE